MVSLEEGAIDWRKNGEKTQDRSGIIRYDMTCAWGLFHKTQEAGNVVQEQNSADSGNSVQSVQQEPTIFSDGKKLVGTDLGAKGVLEAAPIYSKSFTKSEPPHP